MANIGTPWAARKIKPNREIHSHTFKWCAIIVCHIFFQRESQGTVYFSDDVQEAQEAVADTLEEYSNLLVGLDETQKIEVTRTIGLRMEELKAQRTAIEELLVE